MSYPKNTAVDGFTFGMVTTAGAAHTGGSPSGYVTIDDGSQAALDNAVAEKGNGQYSVDLTAAEMNGDQIGLAFTDTGAVPAYFNIKTTRGSTAISGESDLSLALSNLRTEVSWYYLSNDDYSTLSAANKTRVDRVVHEGCRRFYHPPPLPGERVAHLWRFLQPRTSTAVAASQTSFDLADDFGGMLGPLYYASGDSRWFPVTEVGIDTILRNRMKDHSSITFWPTHYAVVPQTSDGSDGQRYKVELWPKTDQAYTFHYQYHVYMDKLTDANPYPYGGSAHASTILQSCLAVAEERLENQRGVQYEAYIQLLSASVAHDRQLHTPDKLGANLDRSDGYPGDLEEAYRYFGQDSVTYSGNTQP